MALLNTFGSSSARGYGRGIGGGGAPFLGGTFTTGGQTGRTGPTLATLTSAYSGQPFLLLLDVPLSGYQRISVPTTGAYRITAVGATGGTGASGGFESTSNDGGYGARAQGDFVISGGSFLLIVVGQYGGPGSGEDFSGGGGASFVALGSDYTTATPLVIGGAGGGWTAYSRVLSYKSTDGNGGTSGSYSRIDANSSQIGNSGYGPDSFNTNYGYGGIAKGAAGGFYSSGSSSETAQNGGGFRQGCVGGSAGSGTSTGGFGGGGGGFPINSWAGSGGGWSGGNGTDNAGTGGGIPGGGGSYVNSGLGTNTSTTRSVNTARNAHGSVVITKL